MVEVTPDPAPLVQFVDDVPGPTAARRKWETVRAQLANDAGRWALINAKGGWPKSRLADLGCEVRTVTVDGEKRLYARWPA